MKRVVVDTSVFVSAFIGRTDAAPARLLHAARERRFMIVASPGLLSELSEVLRRPKLSQWAAENRAETYVAGLTALAETFDDPASPPAVTRDVADDYLVALAEAAGADAIVSLDRDLLDAELTLPVVLPAEFLAGL